MIEKYPDWIEMRNPGISIVGKKQMLRGGESEPHNGSLMKMFNLTGFGECAGSGVPDIYATWRKAGYVDHRVEEQFCSGQPNRTIVTLSLVEKENQTINHSKALKHQDDGAFESAMVQSIIKILKEQPDISQVALGERLGVTRRVVQRSINYLKDTGRVVRMGGKRYGHWEVTE